MKAFFQDLKRIFYFRNFFIKTFFWFLSPLANVNYWVAWSFSWIFIWIHFSLNPVRSYLWLGKGLWRKKTLPYYDCNQELLSMGKIRILFERHFLKPIQQSNARRTQIKMQIYIFEFHIIDQNIWRIRMFTIGSLSLKKLHWHIFTVEYGYGLIIQFFRTIFIFSNILDAGFHRQKWPI